MKERQILFNGPMVRAIMDGRKTKTRRVVNPQPTNHHWESLPGYSLSLVLKECNDGCIYARFQHRIATNEEDLMWVKCPYGKPGDLLRVREHHARIPGMVGMHQVHYFSDGPLPTIDQRHDAFLLKSYPSIHMPSWAIRITKEVTGIRAERLQDISEDDAKAEGLAAITKDGQMVKYGIPDRDGLPGNDDYGWNWSEWEKDPRIAFRKLWESINGPGSWKANPWVWVVDFKMLEAA